MNLCGCKIVEYNTWKVGRKKSEKGKRSKRVKEKCEVYLGRICLLEIEEMPCVKRFVGL